MVTTPPAHPPHLEPTVIIQNPLPQDIFASPAKTEGSEGDGDESVTSEAADPNAASTSGQNLKPQRKPKKKGEKSRSSPRLQTSKRLSGAPQLTGLAALTSSFLDEEKDEPVVINDDGDTPSQDEQQVSKF